MAETPQETPAKPRPTIRKRIARIVLRCCQAAFLLVTLYFLIALVGLIPVNNDFRPTPEGVEIMVTTTAIHADLVLPIRNDTVDWSKHLPPSDFTGDVSDASYVAFGWGNKEFYIETPSWADLKAGTVLRALFWPSATCMHVIMWDDDAIAASAKRTKISNEQYRHLVDYIMDSFRRDDSGRFLHVAGVAYSSNDAFYEAQGAYHIFNTCNCWGGRGLKAAGVRVGWFTPLPKTVTLYMSDVQGQ